MGRSRREIESLREAALEKLALGAAVPEVARELGVGTGTVRRWRRRAVADPVGMALSGGRQFSGTERADTCRLLEWLEARSVVRRALAGGEKEIGKLRKMLESDQARGQRDGGDEGSEEVESVRLPWQEDTDTPDEGASSV
jgi:transposase-like protein